MLRGVQHLTGMDTWLYFALEVVRPIIKLCVTSCDTHTSPSSERNSDVLVG